MQRTISRIVLTPFIAAYFGFAVFARTAEGDCLVPRGKYESVSESEWEIMLELKRGEKALIIHESWLAGQYDQRDVEKIVAYWSCRGADVEVRYNQVTDTFRYSSQLPYSEFGFHGAGPGLSSTGLLSPNSKIGGATLWKHPIKTGGPVAELPSNLALEPTARTQPRLNAHR